MAQKDVGNKVPIYKLKKTDEVMKYYDEWGEGNKYDQDMVDWNYTGPKETSEVFIKYQKNKDAKIYDAGCGTGLVGVSFSLVKGLEAESIVGSVIKYRFKEEPISYQNKSYLYPLGFTMGRFPVCSKSFRSFTAKTLLEYQSKMTSLYGFSGEYKMLTGLLSLNSEEVKNQIAKNHATVSYVAARCSQYHLQMIPRGVELASWYKKELELLPEDFNESTKSQFFEFFDHFGDSVISGCSVGGRLTRTSYTTEHFVRSHGVLKVNKQAKTSFFASMDGTQEKESQATKEYKQNTEESEITSHGGVWSFGDNPWNSWAESVQRLENVSCASWKAISVADLLVADSAFEEKRSVLKDALRSYHERKGCTNPNASNYDPSALQDDGTCKASFVSGCGS